MTTIQFITRAALICALLLLAPGVHSDMLVSPTRVLMTDQNRSATLVLRNPSDGPRTYRLRWEDKQAREEGGYDLVEEGESWPSARDMVRLSPRQITVGPGENQTVRFSFRPPSDLASGEYRSHVLLQVVPDISEPAAAFGGDSSIDNVGIRVFMQMSFSIPVVVRYDVDQPQVSISSVKAVPVKNGESLGLEVTFDRTGNASSYGRVSVEMQRDADSPIEEIGQHGDLSIFPELDRRKIVIALRDKNIPSGAFVRIAYEGIREYKGVLWAEKVFQTR